MNASPDLLLYDHYAFGLRFFYRKILILLYNIVIINMYVMSCREVFTYI